MTSRKRFGNTLEQEEARTILANLPADPHVAEHRDAILADFEEGCAATGCPNKHRSSGFCDTHYRQWRRIAAAQQALAA